MGMTEDLPLQLMAGQVRTMRIYDGPVRGPSLGGRARSARPQAVIAGRRQRWSIRNQHHDLNAEGDYSATVSDHIAHIRLMRPPHNMMTLCLATSLAETL
jgi:hypothetical protein